MGQITVTISDENQRALEAEAKRRGLSLDATLELTIQLAREARIAEIRQRLEEGTLEWDDVESELDEDDILEWAVQEVREYRRERREWERDTDSADN